jgi:7,8-dihydro-6-hydroxymethylpterin-pyrophosphokinase
LHERAFVLRPLIEIAPTTTIPGHGLARRLLRKVRSQRVAPTRADLIH